MRHSSLTYPYGGRCVVPDYSYEVLSRQRPSSDITSQKHRLVASVKKIGRLPKAFKALGEKSAENWNVSSIVDTLARWYLVLGSELRQMSTNLRAAKVAAPLAIRRLEDVSNALSDAHSVIHYLRAERYLYRAECGELWCGRGQVDRGHYTSNARSSAANARDAYPSTAYEHGPRSEPYTAAPRDPYKYLRGTENSNDDSLCGRVKMVHRLSLAQPESRRLIILRCHWRVQVVVM